MSFPFQAGRGTVVRFDDDRGLGAVADHAGIEFPFHCTAVADGSRSIPEGAEVRFVVVPGRAGRWEADRIEPVS